MAATLCVACYKTTDEDDAERRRPGVPTQSVGTSDRVKVENSCVRTVFLASS